jgi:hypothetical protein
MWNVFVMVITAALTALLGPLYWLEFLYGSLVIWLVVASLSFVYFAKQLASSAHLRADRLIQAGLALHVLGILFLVVLLLRTRDFAEDDYHTINNMAKYFVHQVSNGNVKSALSLVTREVSQEMLEQWNGKSSASRVVATDAQIFYVDSLLFPTTVQVTVLTVYEVPGNHPMRLVRVLRGLECRKVNSTYKIARIYFVHADADVP